MKKRNRDAHKYLHDLEEIIIRTLNDCDIKASKEEIIELCKQNLASYKKPKSVEFIDELPKSSYGKILKRELRKKYWKGQERRIR